MNRPIKASPASALPRRTKRLRQGRVCAHPGCTTILSIYNPSTFCFAHRIPIKPRLRGKKAHAYSGS